MKIEFNDINQITIPYGVVGLRNGSLACFNEEARKRIMDFIKEQVKPENFRENNK
jgi:hypothetical protein